MKDSGLVTSRWLDKSSDQSLRVLGYGYLLWYTATWVVWLKAIKPRQEESK